jgi:hypothetical protein
MLPHIHVYIFHHVVGIVPCNASFRTTTLAQHAEKEDKPKPSGGGVPILRRRKIHIKTIVQTNELDAQFLRLVEYNLAGMCQGFHAGK